MIIVATPFRLTVIAASILVLTGCASGGGASAPAPGPVVVGAGATYTVSGTANAPASITQTLQLSGGVSTGLATTATYTYNVGDGTGTLTGGTNVGAATVTVTPTSGAITGITLNAPNARLSGSTSSFSGTDLQTATTTNLDACAGGNCETSIRDLYLYTDRIGGNFLYLAYGQWFEESGSSGTVNGAGGFLVVGAPTAPANIPVTGTANYSGGSAGMYFNSTGNVAGYFEADFNATANFANRSLAVSTTNTFVDNVSQDAHNYSGTLTYAAGSNQFSGPITTASSGLSGTATGLFFGPAAQEIGGVFTATGGTVTVKGIFVGKQ